MVACRRRSADTQRAAHAAHEAVALDLRPTYHVHYENVAQFVDDPFAWFIWVDELPEVWATARTEDAVDFVNLKAFQRDGIAVPLVRCNIFFNFILNKIF